MTTPVSQQFVVPGCAPIVEIRTTLDSRLPYAAHFHETFSLGLILAGRTRLSLGKESHDVKAGDMVLLAPGNVHSCNPLEHKPRSYHMAHIDASWFYAQAGGLGAQVEEVQIQTPVVTDATLFAEALELVNMAHIGSTAVEHRWAALVAALQHNHACFTLSPPKAKLASSLVSSLPLNVELLEEGYSISQLAAEAGIRRESFSRAFRRATNLPPSRYVHCFRLEYGRRLLREGSSVAEAALACGYVDQSHFHRMFMKYCSVTPGMYRKNRSHPYKK